MHANTAIAFLAPFFVLAQAGLILDSEDISSTCKTICGPMVTLGEKCASNKVGAVNDDAKVDKADATCICPNTSFDVEKIAALCASCVEQNHTISDDDQAQDSLNEGVSIINSIMSTCSFASVTYAAASTTAVSGISVSASPTNITDGMKSTTTTKTSTGLATATGTGTAASATGTSSSSSSSGNAGAMPTPCPAMGVAAAAIAGVVGMMV